MEDEVTLDYDPSGFVKAINRAADAWESMTKTIEDSRDQLQETASSNTRAMKETGSVGKKELGGIGLSMGKLLGLVGLLGAGFAAVKGSLAAMPEIGQALSAAGGIFMRNFLNPIRQELLPLLNKMLQWVQENRGSFVRWGQTLLNVIKAVVQIFKFLGEVVMNIGRAVAGELTQFFGGFTQSFADTLELVIFKLIVATNFILILFQPIFELIGRIIGRLIVGVKGFIDGFMEGASGIFEVIGDIINEIVKLGDAILGGEEGAQTFFNFMRRVGTILGRAFKIAFQIVALLIKWLSPLIEILFTVAKIVGELMLDAFEGFLDVVESIIMALSNIGSVFTSLGRFGKRVAEFFTENLVNPIKEAFTTVEKFIGAVFKEIEKKFDVIGKFFDGLFTDIGKALGLVDEAEEKGVDIEGATGGAATLPRPAPIPTAAVINPGGEGNKTVNINYTDESTNNFTAQGSDAKEAVEGAVGEFERRKTSVVKDVLARAEADGEL